jgi:CHAT domain-containing protein/tetratricopeptide (TPR) repeat protein
LRVAGGMTREQAAPALKMMMRGVEAFESRDLKMAVAAFSVANDMAHEGPSAMAAALRDALVAVKRDNRKALMLAVSRATKAVQDRLVAKPAEAKPNGRAAPTKQIPPPPAPKAPPAARSGAFEFGAAPGKAAPPEIQDDTPPEPESPPPVMRPVKPEPRAATRPPPPPATPPAPPPAAPPVSRAVLLLGEAEHAARRGDITAARIALEDALTFCRDQPEAEDLTAGTHFSRLGSLMVKAGEWSSAGHALREALRIKTKLIGKSNRRIAGDLTMLSAVYERAGDYEQAKLLAQRGLSIRRLQSNGHPSDLAASLRQYGVALLGLEEYPGAGAAFREAMAIAATIKIDDLWMAGLMDELALALARLDEAGSARELHERAFALRRAHLPITHPEIGRSQLHIGGFLLRDGKLDDAAAHFRDAMQIFETCGPAEALFIGQCMEHLALLSIRRNELAPARDMLVAAIDTVRESYGPAHRLVLTFQTELAFLHMHAGQAEAATALAQTVIARTRKNPYGALRRDLWYLLSRLAAAKRENAAAIVFGKLSANARPGQAGAGRQETPMERLFGVPHGDVYRHLAALLAKANRLPETNTVMTMLKESELFDMLRRDAPVDPRRTIIALNETEAAWQSQGTDILREMSVLEEDGHLEHAALPKRRAAAERRFGQWLDHADARCTPEETAHEGPHAGLSALGARVGLLQILPGPHSLFLLLTTTDFQISKEVGIGEPALRRLVTDFRVAVQSQSEGAEAMAKALHGHLIAPVVEIYRELGIKTLLIAAEGAVRYLPFAALYDGEKFLAETTATALLTEAVPYAAAPRMEPATIAAFAAEGLEDDVRRLMREAARGGNNPGKTFYDSEFCTQGLAEGLATHQYIHIAGRLPLDAKRPADSVLHLGDGTTMPLPEFSSGRFYFRDVAMVALTACDTEPTRGGDGREVEGLGALLRWCRAESVMATLWPPADDAPARLVPLFYAFRRDGRSPAMALNMAQRKVLEAGRGFRHPYYWANYFVMGGIE